LTQGVSGTEKNTTLILGVEVEFKNSENVADSFRGKMQKKKNENGPERVDLNGK